MTTKTVVNPGHNEKRGQGGVHGLHLLSTVIDTFIQTPIESPDDAIFSLTFPLRADIAIKNLQRSRILANASMQHDLLTKSARTFPAGMENFLKSNLPLRISRPTKVSPYKSTVHASRSKIGGSNFASPVMKAMMNPVTLSSVSQETIQMLPQFYQNLQNQKKTLKLKPSIDRQCNKKRIRSDSKVDRKKRKIDINIGTIATVDSTLGSAVVDKVLATALMANGEHLMTKKCTAETNYIKHKAVPMREKWMARFLELVEFKKKYGHTKVPHNYPDSPKLAEWIKFQRQQRKLFVKGKHSQLTPERVVMLEKIGFVWEARIDAWESHYRNLKSFKETNGHIYVPVANTVLSQWVKRQRKQYKKYENGQDNSLTSDRVERLNQLGFIWDGRHLTE